MPPSAVMAMPTPMSILNQPSIDRSRRRGCRSRPSAAPIIVAGKGASQGNTGRLGRASQKLTERSRVDPARVQRNPTGSTRLRVSRWSHVRERGRCRVDPEEISRDRRNRLRVELWHPRQGTNESPISECFKVPRNGGVGCRVRWQDRQHALGSSRAVVQSQVSSSSTMIVRRHTKPLTPWFVPPHRVRTITTKRSSK
jgi:hypothetical protein